MQDKSLGALNAFLEWTSSKGLMAKNTVGGRKAAVSAVLGVLAPEESDDVTALDLDDVMRRFINLHGKKYNTSSLNVYRSRTNAALNDFKSWLNDPLSFKPHLAKVEKGNHVRATKFKPNEQDVNRETENVIASATMHSSQSAAHVFPIPIREDVVVRIHNLPFDLTPAEADKIANVVRAMAMS